MLTDDRVRDIVAPIAESAEVELYDLEQRSGLLRVMLDRPDGIDIDTLGELSLRISRALDEHDETSGSKYLLEVTSPGIERPLRTVEHFKAQVGKQITVKLRKPVESLRRLEGELVEATDDAIEISTSVNPTCRIRYDAIEAARVVFQWDDKAMGDKNRNSRRTENSKRDTANPESETTDKRASAK